MKRVNLFLLIGALAMSGIMHQSCEKQNEILEPAASAEIDEQVTTKKLGDAFECELNDVQETVYVNLLVPYFHENVLTNYVTCTTPLYETGECCGGGGSVSLDQFVSGAAGIEDWGVGSAFNLDPLSDGVLSVQEQEGLISRATAIAIDNAPYCSGGQLGLQSITFGASPVSLGGIAIHATATYYSVCYSMYTP